MPWQNLMLEEVKEVSIYTDSEFVRDGVTIVDTPDKYYRY